MAVVRDIYIYVYGSMFFVKFSGLGGASLSPNFRSMFLVNFLILEGRLYTLVAPPSPGDIEEYTFVLYIAHLIYIYIYIYIVWR